MVYHKILECPRAIKNKKWVPLRAMKTFLRKKDGSYYTVSAKNPHQWPCNDPAMKTDDIVWVYSELRKNRRKDYKGVWRLGVGKPETETVADQLFWKTHKIARHLLLLCYVTEYETWVWNNLAGHGSSIGRVSAWHANGPEFDPHVRHILSWRRGHEKKFYGHSPFSAASRRVVVSYRRKNVH